MIIQFTFLGFILYFVLRPFVLAYYFVDILRIIRLIRIINIILLSKTLLLTFEVEALGLIVIFYTNYT